MYNRSRSGQKSALNTTAHHFNPSIFREYDIRGIVGNTLSANDAYMIARAFAAKTIHVTKGEKAFICVGRDGRISSPEMKDAVCCGIIDSGIDVVDIGLGPTPMLYYAAKTLRAAGGIMVTGSHNPPDHNGFKFVFQGQPFFGEAIAELRVIGEGKSLSHGHGTLQERDVSVDYLNTLVKAYHGADLNVAWDAGNGATGDMMSALTQGLPGKHTLLNARIDGTFPSHHPDPTVPENLSQLIDEVLRNHLNAGIAFDGDGDRIGVVDDEGEILWGDQLMMIYSADVLKNLLRRYYYCRCQSQRSIV